MEWIGAAYAAHSEPQAREACYMLESYCQLSPGESVLDVGCGDGRITHLIATNLLSAGGGTVVGVDVTPSQIEYAKENHQAPNLSFRVADALNLPAEFHHKFDWVVSFSCLHRVQDMRLAFTSMVGCMKRGGKFLASFPSFLPFIERLMSSMRQSAKWKEFFQDYPDPFPWKVYPNYHDESEEGMKHQRQVFLEKLEGLLRSVGVTPQQVELSTTVGTFKDEEALKQHISQWLDDKQRVPKDRQDEFMNDFMAEYREAVKDRTFGDLSRYQPDREEGVRLESVHVRFLAVRPPKKTSI